LVAAEARVIGGYQEGGDTDAISYSAYLNGNIRQL
jgi:hypothetical protein